MSVLPEDDPDVYKDLVFFPVMWYEAACHYPILNLHTQPRNLAAVVGRLGNLRDVAFEERCRVMPSRLQKQIRVRGEITFGSARVEFGLELQSYGLERGSGCLNVRII